MTAIPLVRFPHAIRRRDLLEAAASHATRMQVCLRFERHRTWLPQLDVIAMPRTGRRRLVTIDVGHRAKPPGHREEAVLYRSVPWDRDLEPVACIMSAIAWRQNDPSSPLPADGRERLVIVGASANESTLLEANLTQINGVIAEPAFREAAVNGAALSSAFERWALATAEGGEINFPETCHELIMAVESRGPDGGSGLASSQEPQAGRPFPRLRLAPAEVMDEQSFDQLCRLFRIDRPRCGLGNVDSIRFPEPLE